MPGRGFYRYGAGQATVPTNPMDDPMQAKRFAVTNANNPEDLGQPLYDRANYAAAGATQIAFFATQLGQAATLISVGATGSKTKTLRDTNMQNSGVVPTKLFQFVGVSVNFIPLQQATTVAGTTSIADDIMRLKAGGYLVFTIIDKPIFQCPLIAIPEGNPFVAVSTTQNAVTTFATGAQGNAIIPMWKFAIPITLQPFEQFSLTLNWDGTVTTVQTFDILVMLHGFMRRPT